MSLQQSKYSVNESDTLLKVPITMSIKASKDVIIEVTISEKSANGNIQYIVMLSSCYSNFVHSWSYCIFV